MILGGVVTGTIMGVSTFGLISYLFKLHLSNTNIAISGITIGSLAGGLTGYMIYYVLRKAFAFLYRKFKGNEQTFLKQ